MGFSLLLLRQIKSIRNPNCSSFTITPLSLFNQIQPKNPTKSTGFPPIYRYFHATLLDSQEETTINPNSHPYIPEKVVNDSQKICKILSTKPKSVTFESVLDRCSVEMSPLFVLEALKKLSNSGVLALEFFKWAQNQKGFEYDTDCYEALIESLGKIKQFKMIWVLVDDMKSRNLLTKFTFSVIIRRYARAGMIDEALKTFDRIEEFGFEIDLNDFNRFLDALCKSRLVEDAQKVFKRMKSKRFKPDKKSYTILLEGWGQEKNLLMLDEVYFDMMDEGFEPDAIAYGAILNAYCKAGKIDKALEKFYQMEGKGIKPSARIYCILISGLGSVKRLHDALMFFEMSKGKGVPPEMPTYNAVVASYCWSLKFSEAFHMVDEMRRLGIGPNTRTYDIVLHHLIKAKKYVDAYAKFKKMANDKGCDPTLSTYEIMLSMFCSTRQLESAVQIWDQMEAGGVVPGKHLFVKMINSFKDGNRLQLAVNYTLKMMDMGIWPPHAMFGSLKKTLLKKGMKDSVQVLTKKLDALKTSPITG